jgi:hypothetical protein
MSLVIPPNMLEDFESVKLLDLSLNKMSVSPNTSFRKDVGHVFANKVTMARNF